MPVDSVYKVREKLGCVLLRVLKKLWWFLLIFVKLQFNFCAASNWWTPFLFSIFLFWGWKVGVFEHGT